MIPNRENQEKDFDKCLELLQQEGETLEALRERFPDLVESRLTELEAASWLVKSRRSMNPRPGFFKASRVRLTSHIKNSDQTNRIIRNLRIWGRSPALQFLSLVLLIFTMVGCRSSVVRALPFWLPGDSAYPVKMLLEDAKLLMTFQAREDASLHIQFAQNRLMEIQALALEGRYLHISSAVADYSGHIEAALAAIQQISVNDPQQARQLALALHDLLASQQNLVVVLGGMAPEANRAEFEEVRLISEMGISGARAILAPDGSQNDFQKVASANRSHMSD